jgi:hypothetical protein
MRAFIQFPALVLTFTLAFLPSCTYSRTQVTLVGTLAPAKAAALEPAILDRMPQGKVQVVAEGTKTYQDEGWAKDACRDLGCDAAVINGRRPRQQAEPQRHRHTPSTTSTSISSFFRHDRRAYFQTLIRGDLA